MAFKIWHTGVHIQQDKILAVALVREKTGWGLRRWWQLPLAVGTVSEGQILKPEQLTAALAEWRKMLPLHHRIFLAFPASRTLQRTLPRPAMTLRDSEQVAWITSAMNRELDMAHDALRFDFAEDTFSQTFHVTAAQNKEISTLLELAKALRLRLAAITPDAGALTHFLPFLATPVQCIAWRDKDQWLWAMRHQWGRRGLAEAPDVEQLAALLALGVEEIVCCEAGRFDPWSLLTRSQPPLPENGADFSVALALAMGDAAS
ncbi:pilus assembly protein PilM [Enterobacteriaceae bacterium H4N4]|uniref:Pilus assembly protein PilM n=1 Tax=Silvania confinis TaxID=2926470 RepID=A0A9J6Q5V7_9ENTR|nr:pilus assembly protein PilM [Silvania confinis]MCU6667951.1 pilus assembly protein PilM [Silvania confinis]